MKEVSEAQIGSLIINFILCIQLVTGLQPGEKLNARKALVGKVFIY
jgi:hypothetical protein